MSQKSLHLSISFFSIAPPNTNYTAIEFFPVAHRPFFFMYRRGGNSFFYFPPRSGCFFVYLLVGDSNFDAKSLINNTYLRGISHSLISIIPLKLLFLDNPN